MRSICQRVAGAQSLCPRGGDMPHRKCPLGGRSVSYRMDHGCSPRNAWPKLSYLYTFDLSTPSELGSSKKQSAIP